MNLTTAFEKFIERTGHSSLPWQTSRDEMLDIFTSGWLAHAESLKHADDLFPGTLGHLPLGGGEDYTSANVAQLVEQIPCKDKVVGSIPSVGSTRTPGYWTKGGIFVADPDAIIKVRCDEITAEDIYAAYPRKVGKQAAIKAIQKWGKLGLPNLLAKTKAFAACVAQWPEADKKFCPHPATWFNRGSFDDDPKEWVRGAAATPSQFRETK